MARHEVLELAQHAGLTLQALAGLVNKSTATLRRWLRERGIVHRLARRGVESSKRLDRHRWQVERTMAFAGIACTLICYRRPTK